MLKVYIAGSISGLSADDVFNYFDAMERILRLYGFVVNSPMTSREYLREEKVLSPEGYSGASTGHAIYKRDKWMISNSDIVFMNLGNSDTVSIGCMFELAWADMLGKHIVVIKGNNSAYEHAFIGEAADIIFNTTEEALEYLQTLAKASASL